MAKWAAPIVFALAAAACASGSNGAATAPDAPGAAPPEPTTASVPPADAAASPPETQAALTPEALEALAATLRDIGRRGIIAAADARAAAATIRADSSLVRATAALLRTSGDADVLAGVGFLVPEGVFLGHAKLVHEDLCAAVGAAGLPRRRLVAVRAMRADAELRDDVARAAQLSRLRVETDAQVIQALVGWGGDAELTSEVRRALTACIANLEVPSDPVPSPEHPARRARSAAYEILALDAIARADWEPLVARTERGASPAETSDLVAGLCEASRRAHLWSLDDGAEARRAWVARLYRASDDPSDRRKLLWVADHGLSALVNFVGPDERYAEGRRATIALLRSLIEFETDRETLVELRELLAWSER